MISVRIDQIQKEAVDAWFLQWEQLQVLIHASHERRDGQAKSLMEEGISLFERFILQASETTQLEIQRDDVFELMPLNGVERLMFIKARPGQFACFRQLDELFKETKKRTARLRIKK